MIIKGLRYILMTLPLAMATGCTDDVELPGQEAGGWGNPDVVTFTAEVGRPADKGSRATDGEGKKLYEPLELRGEETEGFTLYLHTYDSERIGFRPGDGAEAADSTGASRGYQIETIEQLKEHHTDFMALALYEDGTTEYIPWCKARESGQADIWLPDLRTYYWPSRQVLNFYAVAPTSEYNYIKSSLETHEKTLINFSYTARKGNGANNDAVAQTDLMVATASCNKAGSVDGHAPLQFHHALSAVKFAVRDVLDGEVVNIRIEGVMGSGSCTYTAEANGSGGTFDWHHLGSVSSYSQNFNYELKNRPIVDPTDDKHDLLLNETMPEKTFMLIPQQIPDDARIVVTLKRTNPGTDEDGNPLPKEITVSGKIKANGVEEWKAGHEYVYTISTSKDNWVYVFKVYGNHDTTNGAHEAYGTGNPALNGNSIYIYSPSETQYDVYKDSAYIKVRSFRYRANQPTVAQELPWVASHPDGKQYRVVNGTETHVPGFDIDSAKWIKDLANTDGRIRGTGKVNAYEVHKLEFYPHEIRTDWPGDDTLQLRKPYREDNSETKPWDLSTCGDQVDRTTANCYVVDREGWYCFPLVYGNAISKGSTNSRAYTYAGTGNPYSTGGNYLKTFVDHQNRNITSPNIPSNYIDHAKVLWADVYDAISDVKIATVGSEKMIVFKANKYNLQQGNVVIGLYNRSGTITWSWHIWITEHWLHPTKGIPEVFLDSSFAWETSKPHTPGKPGRRTRGDLLIDNKYVAGSYGYMIAPYNVGWCDPKSIDYLRRREPMTFVQYRPDGTTPTGRTEKLPIMQDGTHIEYKFGNNVYFQWGRKDPYIGFVDHNNHDKRNFGNIPCTRVQQTASGRDMGYSISHPNQLFCKGTAQNWCAKGFRNYWNNSTSSTNTLKTIYDPCPPGYMIPPAKAFEFVGPDDKGSFTNSGSDNDSIKNKFNGNYDIKVDEYTFKACIKNKTEQTEKNTVWLTSTGHRWWNDGNNIGGTIYNGGDNFNANLVYLQSCSDNSTSNHIGYSLSLGLDRNYVPYGAPAGTPARTGFVITPYFQGRKSMARPVRPIREL